MLTASGHSAAQSTDLPVRLQSIQHLYAITKRCETVAPDLWDSPEFESLVEQALSGK